MADLTELRPEVLKAQVEALRENIRQRPVQDTFRYQSYSRDLNLLLDDLFANEPPNPLGIGLFWVAAPFVEDCYFEKGALQPLVRVYAGHRYQTPATFERLLRGLEETGQHDLIERLWTSVTSKSRAAFLVDRAGGDRDTVNKLKEDALDGYTEAIAWMRRIGRDKAAARFVQERAVLREERFASLSPPSDMRRLDDTLFWELIRKARSQSESTIEQVALLGQSLREFKPGDISRFGRLYAKLMRQLHHWNVWALAYAARGGCSEDAFEEFRAWLILRGDRDLVALAIEDPARAAMQVPSDPELPEGSCVSIIQEAYLHRAGTWLELPALDLDRPKGRQWAEDALDKDHPDLAHHYASAQSP